MGITGKCHEMEELAQARVNQPRAWVFEKFLSKGLPYLYKIIPLSAECDNSTHPATLFEGQ